MAIGDDFSVALTGDIRHVSGTTTYRGLELHRWLSDLADDEQASVGDYVDITSYTPSERFTDQIFALNDYSSVSGPTFNIDDTAAEYLYDTSIDQRGGDEQYSGLVMVGSVPVGTEIQVIQDEQILTSFWSDGLNAVPSANILNQVLIKSRTNGANIDGKKVLVVAREWTDTYAEFSVTLGQANSVAAIFTSDDLNNQTLAATVGAWGITNTEGYQEYDITGDLVNEPYYSQWNKGTQSNNDLYEFTKHIGRRGTAETIHGMNGFLFRGITHTWTYDGEVGGPFTENEEIVWGTKFNYDNESGATSWTVGEYLGFGTSGAVGKLLLVNDAGTTGSMVVAIEAGSGTVVDGEQITQLDGGDMTADVNGAPVDTGVSGGVGTILADDSTGNEVWIQLLSGSAPVDNLEFEGRTSGATADVAGSVSTFTVNPEFIGQSTGTNLIGTKGIGVLPAEAVVGDKYTDLDGNLRQPPNNVTFTVGALVSGEDRVLVTNDASGIDWTQFSLNTTLDAVGETAVVVGAAIPTDTPSTGVIRIELDDGRYRYQPYTGYSGSTFTIAATDYSSLTATAANNVFIGYIDKLADAATLSFTGVYLADRTMFVRVRDGGTAGDLEGIKTFEATADLTANGGGLNAIRTSDA